MNNILSLDPPIVVKSLFSLNWKKILRVFLVLSILSVISLLISFIFQINAEVSERYLIQEYESRLNKALKDNQSLEIGLVQANSLNNVLTLMEELNFEKINKIHYIRVLNNQIVTKQ